MTGRESKGRRKGGQRRSADPFLERERERYGHALPSRELILDVMREQGVPLPLERLMALLEIAADEQDIFLRRLGAMERDGQVMRNRKGALCVVEKLDLVVGTVQGHPDGYGFLVPDEGGADLFLGAAEMNKVLHRDRAVARIVGVDRRGRPEGKIVEVLERANRRVVGRIYAEHGILFVVAEDKRISQDILVEPGEHGGAQPGQVVVLEIVQQPSKHAQAIGRVVEVLGNYADPGMEIEIALRKHELPHVFSPEAERLTAKLPKRVRPADLDGREDLRDLPLVTIDGENARDFDDAVWCEPLDAVQRPGGKGAPATRGGFRLIVAIADVSHYVRHGDALDREAFSRGNSVYFPRRVIPMLPEALSNVLCSLNPEVDRLAVACEMVIGGKGELLEYRFFPAVIRSHARLTYTEVAQIIADPHSEAARNREALVPHLLALHALYKVLLKAREKRGAIDFETVETGIDFDERGKILRLYPVQRNDAHRLIEECMLAANVCASDFLRSHGQVALYRVHEGPTPEKLAGLREFLKEFGLQITGGDEPHARDYAKLLARVKDRPDALLLQTVMLRSLKQALYSPENVGHFGLAYESYTHFTSPIRRYPDLLVHRAIKAVLSGSIYDPGDWYALGAHCSMTERRADDATRDVVAWLKCYFMQDKLGQTFAGTISAVTAFGVFVALDDIYVEGLVHVTELGNDYFHFDPVRHRMLGERTARQFRLADRLTVKVARVDLETSRIDFVLADEPAQAGRKRG